MSGEATGSTATALIAEHADTWRLLAKYDEGELDIPSGVRPSRKVLALAAANRAIAELKRELVARGEASPLFGRPRNDGLAGILGAIEQTMFGEPLYSSREEKAAHLLYFVVKDHPFADGNKRIASLLFLIYLEQERASVVRDITSQALTTLTLLVAKSAPAEKDQMVRLVVNLLRIDC